MLLPDLKVHFGNQLKNHQYINSKNCQVQNYKFYSKSTFDDNPSVVTLQQIALAYMKLLQTSLHSQIKQPYLFS